MTETRPHLEPGPDHPITVERTARRIVVRAGGEVIAETTRALELREASYPPVFYVPLDDVDRSRLRASDQHTYCPYKGEASYFDVVGGPDGDLVGAVWCYREPYPAVAAIAGLVAFYPDRLAVSAEQPES